MAELAAIGLASNILQFVEIGYKLTRRILEFADNTNDVPTSIRHLYDRLPLILYVLNQVAKWSEDEPPALQDKSGSGASLLLIIVESRECVQDLFDILEEIRPRPESKAFKKVLKAVKSVSKEDSIQKLLSTLDKDIALLTAYQNLVNTGAVQKLAKGASTSFALLSTDISTGFKHVLSDLQRTSLLDWIGQEAFADYHQIHGTARVADTCSWIWHRKPFLDWQKPLPIYSSANYLWIHGSSGMGKTFLSARISEDLSKFPEHEGYVFAYFCRHESKSHFATEILRSLLSRMVIADHTSTALELIQPFFQTRKSRTANYDELWSMFQVIVSSVDKYVFVIDGLDEYIRSETDDLSDNDSTPFETLLPSFLQRLVQATASAACRVLIVSRDHREIRSALAGAQNSSIAHVTEYEIHETDLQTDALLLARHIVNSRLPKQDSLLREELAQSIAQKSAGQMLWVRLQEQVLKPSYKDQKLRQLVQNMPTGLRDTYDKQVLAMMKLPPPDRDRARRLLRWVLFARNPVTIHLSIEVMLVDLSSPTDTFPDDDLPRDVNEDDVSDEVKQLCQFVDFRRSSLDQEQRHWVVAFPHASRKEHLLSIDDEYQITELQELRFADRPLQESILTQTCLHYLSLTNVWSSPDSGDSNLKEIVDHRPFLPYAILNWPYHAIYGISEEACRAAVANFCAPDNPVWDRWRDGFEKLTQSSRQEEESQNEPGNRLYYACEFGYISLIQELLKGVEDSTKPCGRKGSPMHAAIAHGNVEIIKLLLGYARNLNVRNRRGETIIHSMIRDASDMAGNVPSTSQTDHLANNIFRRTSSFPPTSDERRDITSILLDGGLDLNAVDKAGWTCVNRAAAKGQLEVVELLIKRGANINLSNDFETTPVSSAADGGHEEVVELLVHHGADISKMDREARAPIHSAAAKGHLEVVKLLIKCGADMMANSSWTPIHSAADGGHKEVVELLIRSGASLVMADSAEMTPVWAAADRGHKQVVEFLLQQGADYKKPSKNGRTPLCVAVELGHKEIVELLIQHGADINKTICDKDTLLYTTASKGFKDIVDLLIQHGANNIDSPNAEGWTPVNIAAGSGHEEVVKLLLKHEADITIVDTPNGGTPLYNAALNGHCGIVELLIQHGADIHTKNVNGWTPVNVAAFKGREDIVKLLIQHGADISTADTSNNGTPLYNAAIEGHIGVVKVLLRHGADVSSRSVNGWTPVNFTVERGHLDIVKLLIQHGADINLANKDNRTPLFCAACNGSVELVELLLQQGADLEPVNATDGWTAIGAAAVNGHIRVVELLIRHGANLAARDSLGWGPLAGAVTNGHVEIAKLLIDRGADVSTAHKSGGTVVGFAAYNGDKAMVELLLQSGGDINEADDEYDTPLYSAAFNGHDEVLQYLIDKGADIDLHDGYYTSALYASLSYGSERLVDAQLAKGANLRMVDFRSAGSALAASLYRFSSTKIQLILDLIKNEKWYLEALQEFLCLATEGNLSPDVCQRLSDAGASSQLPGVYGWTPAQCSGMKDALRPAVESSKPLPVPTQWSPFDNENVFELSDHNREILVQESARDVHLERRVKVHADFFMPADREVFYFEVTFLAVGPLSLIVVGFTHINCPIIGMPGWGIGSWGYHGDDGEIYAAQDEGDAYGPTYGIGDTIGCGVDFLERSAFFTKNGVHLGTAFAGLTGRLLPACGVGERGTRLRVNFGDDPFVYKGPMSSTRE